MGWINGKIKLSDRKIKRRLIRERVKISKKLDYNLLSEQDKDDLVLAKWRKMNPQSNYFLDADPVRYD